MSKWDEEPGESQSNRAEDLFGECSMDSPGFKSERINTPLLSYTDRIHASTSLLPDAGFIRTTLKETPLFFSRNSSEHPELSKNSSKKNSKKIHQTRTPLTTKLFFSRSNQISISDEGLGQNQSKTAEDLFSECTTDSLGFKSKRLNTPFLSCKDRIHTSTPVLPVADCGRTILSIPFTLFFSESLSEAPEISKNSSKKSINEISQTGTASTTKLFFSKPKKIHKIDPCCTSENITKNSILHPDNPLNSNLRMSLNISDTKSKSNTEKCDRVIDNSIAMDDSFWDSVDFNQLDRITANKDKKDNEGSTGDDIIGDISNPQILLDKQLPSYTETNHQKDEQIPDTSTILIGLNPLFWTLAKFTIKNILCLREENSKFYVRNHPVKLVEIIGIVTSLTIKDKFVKFVIEDTTGRIECIKWKNAHERWIPSDINDIEISSLVRLKGKLGAFRGQREVKVYDVYILEDFNILTVHLLECEAALSNIYSVDFVMPDCGTMVGEFREKVRKAVYNNIIEKGEDQNIEEYLQIGGVKHWLDFVSAITKQAKLDVLSEIVDEIQSGKSLSGERKARDKIRVNIIDLLSRNSSLSLKDLRKFVPGIVTKAREEQMDSVLDDLLMSGDIYEVDFKVYKKL